MRTLVRRLPSISGRRLALSGGIAVGTVLVAGSLAWACTALVHNATFNLVPEVTTCEQVSGSSYNCQAVEATLGGHSSSWTSCSAPLCESVDVDVHQRMYPRERPDWALDTTCDKSLDDGDGTGNDTHVQVGTITLSRVGDVQVPGDPQGVNGVWHAGTGTVTPQVDGAHPSNEVRWYPMCAQDAESILGIATIG